MLTVEDALVYLGYDEVDDAIKTVVSKELESAKSYLQGAVGEDVFDLLPDHPTVNSLLCTYLDETHNERQGLNAKAAGAKREFVISQEWQLRMKLVQLRAEAAEKEKGTT